MNIRDFFNSPVMALPRDRTDPDYEHFLRLMFKNYLATVDALDVNCHICQRIQIRKGEIQQLVRWICGSVRHYLEGLPAKAYKQLEHGIDYVSHSQTIDSQVTLSVGNDAIRSLYRMIPNVTNPIDKNRLFHCPFNDRHKVKRHRYGIPGFPCLYLGGSLEVCQRESRVEDKDLPSVAVGEFELRSPVKLLNFGYRPSGLAMIAGGSSLRPKGANSDLEKMLIDYAICWPLLAAASIIVMHDRAPFVHEYIIPQMILQWIMLNKDCDGIRFFSTRWNPDPLVIRETANYVFPAKPPPNAACFSQPLINKFAFTDVLMWRTTTAGVNLTQERTDNVAILHGMPKAPLR